MADWPQPFPDSELMVVECLKHYLPIAYPSTTFTIVTEPPKDWSADRPVVVVTRTGGSSSRVAPEHRVDNPIISVMVFGIRRKVTGDYARMISRILHQAVLDRWELAGSSGGVFTRFHETKGPVHVSDGLTGKHPEAAMFDATYQLWLRGHYS